MLAGATFVETCYLRSNHLELLLLLTIATSSSFIAIQSSLNEARCKTQSDPTLTKTRPEREESRLLAMSAEAERSNVMDGSRVRWRRISAYCSSQLPLALNLP
jgi:hypothetical protein